MIDFVIVADLIIGCYAERRIFSSNKILKILSIILALMFLVGILESGIFEELIGFTIFLFVIGVFIYVIFGAIGFIRDHF